MLTKPIITGVLLASLGGGVYHFGESPLHAFLDERLQKSRVQKQIIPVKPKAPRGGKKMPDAVSSPVMEYTFFDTLTDPQAGNYLGLNGVNVPKAPRTRLPGTSVRPAIPSHKTRRNLPDTPITINPVEQAGVSKGYMVQVGSFRELNGARSLEARLSKNGYSPFLMEADIPGKGIWHRVYLGRYANKEDALLAAESAKINERLSAIVHQAG